MKNVKKIKENDYYLLSSKNSDRNPFDLTPAAQNKQIVGMVVQAIKVFLNKY